MSEGAHLVITLNNNMVESIEAIVKLLLFELGNLGDVGVTMKRMVGVEAVSVLRTVVVSLQDWVGVPSCPIEVGSVGRKSTPFRVFLVSLHPFLSFPVGGVEEGVGSLKGIMSG